MAAEMPLSFRPLPATAVRLPFIGSRATPHTAFQYVLDSVDARGAVISCPSWLVRREHFRPGDHIDLHFPFRTTDGWQRQQAEVMTVTADEVGTGQICATEFRDHQPLHHPVYAAIEASGVVFRSAAGDYVDRSELLGSVLHDCALQKRGIGVYFKHLVPLFSRITLFPAEDFGVLRAMVLEDIRQRIETNIAAFEGWHERAATGVLTSDTLSEQLDLEAVRAAVEAEIDNDLLGATFDTPVIRPYITAIRLLEQKLYLNYNTLVLLYAQGL